MRRLAPVAVVLLLLVGAQGPLATDLGSVADRLGGRGRFDALTSLRVVADVEAATPTGEVALRSTLLVRFPEAVRFRQELPSGTVVTVWADGVVRTRAADTTRVLGPEAARRLRGQLFLTLPYLLARRRDVVLDRISWEGDDTLLDLKGPGLASPIRLVVGPDGLPVSASTRLDGAEVAVAFSRYRRTDGLLLPSRTVQTVNGDTTGTTTHVSVDVDPALSDRLFTLD